LVEIESVQERTELKGLYPEELEAFVCSLGLETYRARQIAAWIYNSGTTDFEEMTNLSKSLRAVLSDQATILNIETIKEQGTGGDTVKFLFGLDDGRRIESVLMREGKRRTLCISSQVGCPLDCLFCATGRMGLIRNLTAAEILDQLIKVRKSLRDDGEDLTNVVMMGMGEPLLNFDEVIRAIRLMNLDYGPAVGMRRITLSTVGYVPGILKLSQEGLKVGLAISLNATTDEQRSQIMPINKKWPIADLLDAIRSYRQRIDRRVTFEYVLLHGFNDSEEDARRLVNLVRDISCKINLIPWNPIPDALFESPPQSTIDAFLKVLTDSFLTATVRYSKGTDISAGCGQLFQEFPAQSV
jgi:23S rRNA (adenine2503-C2)-methyltransferase